MNPALQGLITVVIGVGGCIGYFYFSNILLDRVLFKAEGPDAGRNINRREAIRPWLFLFPAMFALGLYLAYPVFATLWYSLTDRDQGGAFVGLANYSQMLDDPKFWEALTNNMLWLIVVPAASTAFGLLAAQLTDRIRWGSIAKSMIFMPMAISFVGASVIFKLIYDSRPQDVAQIGVLNALWLRFDGGAGSFLFLRLLPAFLALVIGAGLLWMAWSVIKAAGARRGLRPQPEGGTRPSGELIKSGLPFGMIFIRGLRFAAAAAMALVAVWLLIGIPALFITEFDYGAPQQWLQVPFWNNFFLMIVLIWIQTGFAMVILSAALRGIPEETVEAAIIDGANPFQVFFRIKMPQIASTIVVVWTTITIVVLKVFDIVFAMTNGQWETQVLANYMYEKLFRAFDWGVGSAAAMVIMLLVTPILVWNVYNARKEMR